MDAANPITLDNLKSALKEMDAARGAGRWLQRVLPSVMGLCILGCGQLVELGANRATARELQTRVSHIEQTYVPAQVTAIREQAQRERDDELNRQLLEIKNDMRDMRSMIDQIPRLTYYNNPKRSNPQ